MATRRIFELALKELYDSCRRGRIFLAPAVFLLCLPVSAVYGRGQGGAAGPGQAPAPATVAGTSNPTLGDVEQRLQKLQAQLDSEKEATKVKLDAVATATDRVFNLFYVFGAVGTVLSAVFIVFSALRERQARSDYLAAQEQHSNDYKGERRFYEERALAYERRERASQDYILTLARKTSGREFRLLDQQISQGQVSTIRSREILTEQLRSLSQLGDVIKLVKETFHLELTKSKEDIEERRKRQETEHMVGAFRGFYKARYTRVNELISSFGRHTAMDWTALTDEEIALALRARIMFEGIPEFVLEDERTSDRWAFARTCQLLGVSAFYANDIESAIELLNRSRDIYSKEDLKKIPPDEVPPCGYANHFLGVLEKAWRPIGRDELSHLNEVKKHFAEALEVFAGHPRRLLPAVTLAEVLSYLPDSKSREDSRNTLTHAVEDLEKAKKHGTMDKNQQRLLGRAYLILGNLCVVDNRSFEAAQWFEKGENHDSSNPFFSLSHAAILSAGEDRRKRFTEALHRLEESDSLKKREVATRAIGLSWAIVASKAVEDGARLDHYRRMFSGLGTSVRQVAGREQLFFCPTTKQLLTFVQFQAAIDDLKWLDRPER